jgi:hypothetical protein
VQIIFRPTKKDIVMRILILIALLSGLLVLQGCATSLDSGADKVRLITAEQKSSCDSLGIVSADQQLGLNKLSNSMNSVLNEVARRGGNGVFIISSGSVGLEGASVTAEALRCK